MKLPLALSLPLLAISLANAESSPVLNPTQLAGIPAAMEAEVAAHHTAGSVTLVLQDGKVIHHSAPLAWPIARSRSR
jgi:hypothetical protein